MEGVESTRGLIDKDELGVVKKLDADIDALSLPARNASHSLVADKRIAGIDETEL